MPSDFTGTVPAEDTIPSALHRKKALISWHYTGNRHYSTGTTGRPPPLYPFGAYRPSSSPLSRYNPDRLQVYEGVGGGRPTGAWFLHSSGNAGRDGTGVGGRDAGGHDTGGGGGGGGGGGRESLDEGKAATAKRLGISVREVRRPTRIVKRKFVVAVSSIYR